MQIKIVNTNLQARYHKSNSLLLIYNDKYCIHMKLHEYRRKRKFVIRCKVKDRKTGSKIFSKIFSFNEKVDLEQIKNSIYLNNMPKELKSIEKYVY